MQLLATSIHVMQDEAEQEDDEVSLVSEDLGEDQTGRSVDAYSWLQVPAMLVIELL